MPRLEEFQLKKLWPKYSADSEFLSYFPDIDEGKYPPRSYFFQIMSSIKCEDFKQLFIYTENSRKNKLEIKNKIVDINPHLWDELSNTRYQELFVTVPASKRIVLKKIKRN